MSLVPHPGLNTALIANQKNRIGIEVKVNFLTSVYTSTFSKHCVITLYPSKFYLCVIRLLKVKLQNLEIYW